MKNFLYTTLIAFSTLACGPANKTEETKDVGSPIDKAETAVMAVHDEVMPQVETMMKLKKQVNAQIAKLDSLEATPTERVRADEEQAQGRLIVRHLTEADSLMMGWMSGYDGDTLKKLPEADALRYLDGQQKKVDDVKAKIKQSIEQAKTYLDGGKLYDTKSVSSIATDKLGIKLFGDVADLQDVLSRNGIGQFRGWRKDETSWISSTDYYLFGKGSVERRMQNDLAYYLDGDQKDRVKILKLVLNVHNDQENERAIDMYKHVALVTFKSLKLKEPKGLFDAISNEKNFYANEPEFRVSNTLKKSRINTWELTIESK